jgi:cyclic beta-1,2-glucan synthetase
MAAVEEYLVRRGDSLVLLFTPPFDRTPLDPGYVKGYVPGVRENGGQYTHAAVWSLIAFAMLGDGDKAVELFSILNPINDSATRAAVHRYKVEPYVAAADVYSEPPHVGRGGWTWYTGAAGWMHRAAIEWILGLRAQGAELLLDPCVPHSWPRYEIEYRHRSSTYDIVAENPDGVSCGVASAELDGRPMRIERLTRRLRGASAGAREAGERRVALIPLVDDGERHRIRIVMG